MLFVEFFRCTPAIVQIVWFFYCVPMLFNVFLGSMTMGILALGLNLTAFNAEAYRAAIQAVPREHLDAGIALGLNPLQRILYIVLPTAFRASIPVLLTNGIGIFQQSALVAIVGCPGPDVRRARSLATETYRPIETFTVVALDLLRRLVPGHRSSSAIFERRRKSWYAEEMHMMTLDFCILLRFQDALLLGLWMTLKLTLICIVLGVHARLRDRPGPDLANSRDPARDLPASTSSSSAARRC